MYVCLFLVHWSCLGPGTHHLSPGQVEHSWRHCSPRSYHPAVPLSSLPWLCSFCALLPAVFSAHKLLLSWECPNSQLLQILLEHVKIGKQNKTKNKSLLSFQTQAPGCLPRVLPDPGDKAQRTVISTHSSLTGPEVCGLGEDKDQVSPILLSFPSYCLTSPGQGGPAGSRVVSISLASGLPLRGSVEFQCLQ